MPRAIWALNVIFLRALTIFSGPRFSYLVNGTYNCITVASKFACPVGLPSVNFEGPQAILWAIGLRARLILTPNNNTRNDSQGYFCPSNPFLLLICCCCCYCCCCFFLSQPQYKKSELYQFSETSMDPCGHHIQYSDVQLVL